MVLQSSFGATIPVGYPGQIANSEHRNVITRTIEDAGGIGFGKAAFRGAGDHGVTATPSANFIGVTIVDHGQVRRTGVAADTYAQNDNVPVATRGTLKVLVGANVADGDPVYVTPAGVFTNVNGGGANFRAGTYVYDNTVASGGIATITTNR